jgi:hypothetical protein
MRPKNILLFIGMLLLPLSVTLAQQQEVNQKNEAESVVLKKQQETPVPLFSQDWEPAQRQSQVEKGVILELDLQAVQAFLEQAPRIFELNLPTGRRDEEITLHLESAAIFARGFEVYTSENGRTPLDYNPGLHYHGRIKGEPNSIAAISVFDGEVMGMVGTENGNYTLGKIGGSRKAYAFYLDKDLVSPPSLNCEMPEDGRGYSWEEISFSSRDAGDCTNIYIEGAQSLFNSLGSAQAVANVLIGVFNQSAIIYKQESLETAISEILIWTTPDPYPALGSTTDDYLNAFKANTGAFNGDLGHLVALDNVGGLAAGFSGICNSDTDESLCFSGFSGTGFNQLPTSSFNVYLFAHELGHLFGSRHTHACVWNGNSTAIDGCSGSTEGTCTLPPSPAGGGTIMSYCNNDPVGIDFTQGFGPQPGNVIRNTINNASCLSNNCVTPINDVCSEAFFVDCGFNYIGSTLSSTSSDAPDNCSANIFGPGVWYRLEGTGQIITLDLSNADFDTQVTVFSGSCGSLICVGGDDDSGSGNTSLFTFCTMSGEDYWIYIDGFADAVGAYEMDVSCSTDNTSPSISCPANITTGNDIGDCGAIVNYSDATASDICGIASITYTQNSGTFFPVGTTMVTATATDNSNLKGDCSFSVTVNDNEDPNAVCKDVNVYLDSNGEGSTSVAQVNNGSSDNCGIKSFSLDPVDFDCDDLDDNTVTLTVTDDHDNTDQCEATVTVIDDTPPVAVCLNSTVEIQWDGFYTLQESDVFDAINSSDNCFITNVDFPPTVFDCDDKFMSFDFLVTVADQSGNTDDCTASVYVDVSNALPPQWSTASIGNSSNTYAFDPCSKPNPQDGDYTITSTGNTTPDNSFDNMGYMYQPLCGNSGMQFKVEDVDNGYVGLMMRESGNPGSKMVGVFSNLTSLLQWHTRYQTGGNANSIMLYKPFPYWLRLVRQGPWIRGYFSQYGNNWQLIHQVYLPMKNCIGVGVAVYTTDPDGTAEAVVSHVSTVSNPIFLGGGTEPQGISAELPETSMQGELGIHVFPNPASEELFIELETIDDLPVTYQLYNAVGQAMQTRQHDSSKTTTRWDISLLKPGTYLLEARLDNGQRQVIRFIKASRP